ncbi:MAG: tRNA 2-thiouridine(34) synthase MnmA [Gemmatimonadetes bacterium]|nr:tRNA 2-thiouridine(34) synthase MnmA [Gemmatimonadota bacterium]
MPATKPRVLIAMSGGVDSSVAAALLVREGYDCVGVTMKLFEDGAELPDRPCCSLDSTSDARRVAERLGIPHYVLNMVDHFGRDVIADFVAEYARGRTPIPCVRCNTFTKFSDLVKKADAIDAVFVATGHYARTDGGRLLRGADAGKDQTYFLWGIDRGVIPRLLLPVGGITKDETRRIARELELPRVADKQESQEICFVPDGDYLSVLRRELPPDAPAISPGPFVLADGTTVGEHEGFARFTIGQRRAVPGGFAAPMFVVAIRPDDRAVVLGPREALLGRGLVATGTNWLSDTPRIGDRLGVRVRHRAPIAPAEVIRIGDSEIEVALDAPVAAIAPGQSAVFYDGDVVVGGGFIASARPAERSMRRLPVLSA